MQLRTVARKGCTTFEQHPERRLFGLALSTVKYMLIAKRHVEQTEPNHVAAARLGPIAAESSDASDEQVSALPSYAAVSKLNALRSKAALGVIPRRTTTSFTGRRSRG